VSSTVPHQALYRRWRAQTFSQIVGQEAVVETLRNAVRMERVAHAVLFVGPRGTGKTSLARILAKAVNCLDLRDGDPCDVCGACVAIREGTTLDVLEIDAASNRGINEVRDLRDRLAYPPAHLRRKVYILDEAHQITRDAWNALLKSLEEPPDFVIFMFASTEPSGFPPAILSRLQRYDVRRLTVPEIEGKLTRILEADGRAIEPAALTLIARLAAGGMRDAESILDQLLSMTAERIEESAVRDLLGLAEGAAVDGFVQALVAGDAPSGIAILDQLDERGRDPRAFLDQVVDAVRGRLLDASVVDVSGLTAVARRLVAIDPDRAVVGGVRLQLELALFEGPLRARADALPAVASASAPATAVPAAAEPPAAAVPATSDPPPPTVPEASAASATPERAPVPAVGAVPPTARRPTAPTPPTTPTTPIIPATDGRLSLERVVAAWPDVVALLSAKPPIKPLILACRPIGVDGAVVVLGFPEEQAFLRDVADRKRGDIEDGVRRVIGQDAAVRCVVANIEVAPVGAADDLVAEARRIFGDDLLDVAEVD
jgi:DNA polymerase III subunit gamma/tau